MEEPVLRDAEEYPGDDVLRRHLGRAMASWQALMEHIEQHDPALSGEWRYYKDGKSWLFKVTYKKLTLCWVAVFQGKFKTTCYFPDRAEAAITGSKLTKPTSTSTSAAVAMARRVPSQSRYVNWPT